MPGILEALFGADGIGGQPGAVGNTLNNGIANTVLGGVGKIIAPVGNAAVGGLGDWVADVVTKNPLEILKNPTSILNDRGEPSWTRVLFPDFRRQDIKAKQQASKALDLKATADSLSMLGDMGKFLQGIKPDQRAPYVAQMEEAGVPSEQTNLALGQANAADQKLAQGQQALGGFLPPEIAGLVDDPSKVPGLYVQNEQAKATESRQRMTDDRANRTENRAIDAAQRASMTSAEKAVEAYQKATASGDPVLIEATKADLLKLGKSSQPMTVTTVDPETGAVSNVTGPASDVSGYESATRRDQARNMVDAADTTLGVIKQVRDIAVKNPEAFGAAGTAMRFGQGALGQAEAFTSIQNKARADIAAGNVQPQTAKQLLEGFQPEAFQADSLLYTLAYAQARLNNPTGVLTDKDFEQARAQIGANGPLTTNKSVLVSLDLLEANATQKRRQNLMRSRKGGGTQSKLEAAIAGESPASTKKPFGKKNAGPGETRGGAIPDSELRLLRDEKALNALSESDQRRWMKLNGVGDGE